ncbi:MAG: hypothetical protein QXT63_02730 [Thermoplasmata archaeon]
MENRTGDWRETLHWLEENYEYPDKGNYDWPDSTRPKVIENRIRAIDGTLIPILPGAYDVTLVEGYSVLGTLRPQCTVQYRIKFENRDDAKRKLEQAVRFFMNTYKVDFSKLNFTQYENAVQISGTGTGLDSRWGEGIYVEFLIPGRLVGKAIELPDTEDYFTFNYSLLGIEHFYFDRTNLRVIDDTVVLSDGTLVPIFPKRKIIRVTTGNVQDTEPPEVIVEYSYKVVGVKNHDSEFVNLYTFYAKHFGFPVSSYTLWDVTSDDFTIEYDSPLYRVRINSPGHPIDNGRHADVSNCQEYTIMHISIFLKNKRQIIPRFEMELHEFPTASPIDKEDYILQDRIDNKFYDEVEEDREAEEINEENDEVFEDTQISNEAIGIFEAAFSVGNSATCCEPIDDSECESYKAPPQKNKEKTTGTKIKIKEIAPLLAKHALMFEQYPNGRLGLMGMAEARLPAGDVTREDIEKSELEELLNWRGLKLIFTNGKYDIDYK